MQLGGCWPHYAGIIALDPWDERWWAVQRKANSSNQQQLTLGGGGGGGDGRGSNPAINGGSGSQKKYWASAL
jgi:hypothetical protein